MTEERSPKHRRRFTGSISALWSAITGRRGTGEMPAITETVLMQSWQGAHKADAVMADASRAAPPAVVERERDGVVARFEHGLLSAQLDGDAPPFSFVPARDAAPPRIRGDRVAGQIVIGDPARAAARKALDAGALFEEGAWQCRMPPEATADDIAARGELLIDAALAVRTPPAPVTIGWFGWTEPMRLRLLVLCHLDGHPQTGKVRSLALRDEGADVRAVAEGLRSKGILPTLIQPPVPADLRGEVIGRLDSSSRLSALMAVLEDPDPTAAVMVVPHLAADGLGALTPALAAPHGDVRLAAVRALMNLDGDKLRPATDAMDDPDARVVKAAATVLAYFGGETSARVLRAKAKAPGTPPKLAKDLEKAARVIIQRYDAVGQGDKARRSLGYPTAAEEEAARSREG